MDEQSVKPGQMLAAGMDENDKCYFYIRRGWWPAPETNAVPYALQRQAEDWTPEVGKTILFRSGVLVVTGPRPPSPQGPEQRPDT
jgi:hypothetical protein